MSYAAEVSPHDAGRRPCWARLTYDEAKFLIIPGVHGLALLHAATAGIGFRLHIKSDSSKFKYDVPLSLRATGTKEERGATFTVRQGRHPRFPGAGMNHCVKEKSRTKRMKGVQGCKAGLGTLLRVLSLVLLVSPGFIPQPASWPRRFGTLVSIVWGS